MKLYLTCITAARREVGKTSIAARAVAVLANNDDEGLGKALRIGKEVLPISEGWTEHEISGDEITSDTVRIWATAYGYVPAS